MGKFPMCYWEINEGWHRHGCNPEVDLSPIGIIDEYLPQPNSIMIIEYVQFSCVSVAFSCFRINSMSQKRKLHSARYERATYFVPLDIYITSLGKHGYTREISGPELSLFSEIWIIGAIKFLFHKGTGCPRRFIASRTRPVTTPSECSGQVVHQRGR